MSKTIPDKAFILAAGLGTRMRPHTDTYPKPMVCVGGHTLLMRTIDQLESTGVQDIVINTHYLADKIHEHLKPRTSPRIHISHEATLLNTGGGIKKALYVFGDEPFFVINGDALWTGNALTKLAHAWDPETMDILMLLQPVSSFTLTEGVGDYDFKPSGQAKRRLDQKGSYMFTSLRINHPRIFKNTPDTAFSYLDLMDAAEKAGRLYGLVHDAEFHHISTAADLEAVNKAFKE
jgi:MurNAc alpha-1-phosphate uridylyltransferase